MRIFDIALIGSIGVVTAGAALAQTSPQPAASAGIASQVTIEQFEAVRRADSSAVAAFVVVNGSARTIGSMELNCWIDDERDRGTRVLIWAPQPIPAGGRQQFKNVNIGQARLNSRSTCEVAVAE